MSWLSWHTLFESFDCRLLTQLSKSITRQKLVEIYPLLIRTNLDFSQWKIHVSIWALSWRWKFVPLFTSDNYRSNSSFSRVWDWMSWKRAWKSRKFSQFQEKFHSQRVDLLGKFWHREENFTKLRILPRSSLCFDFVARSRWHWFHSLVVRKCLSSESDSSSMFNTIFMCYVLPPCWSDKRNKILISTFYSSESLFIHYRFFTWCSGETWESSAEDEAHAAS